MVFSGFSPIFGTNLLTKAYISYVVPPLWIIALRRKTASKFSWFSAEVLFCLAFLALGALIVDGVCFWATGLSGFQVFRNLRGFNLQSFHILVSVFGTICNHVHVHIDIGQATIQGIFLFVFGTYAAIIGLVKGAWKLSFFLN